MSRRHRDRLVRLRYVDGTTTSTDFPTTIGPANPGGDDVFVTKLTPDGSTLVYSTYLGGDDGDQGNRHRRRRRWRRVRRRPDEFERLPAVYAFQTSFDGRHWYDAFVTKLDAAGGIVHSSYLGGTAADHATGVAVDTAGNTYVTGYTDSDGFPDAAAGSCISPSSTAARRASRTPAPASSTRS